MTQTNDGPPAEDQVKPNAFLISLGIVCLLGGIVIGFLMSQATFLN